MDINHSSRVPSSGPMLTGKRTRDDLENDGDEPTQRRRRHGPNTINREETSRSDKDPQRELSETEYNHGMCILLSVRSPF